MSPRRQTTAGEFLNWAQGERSGLGEEFASSEYWGYVDYTYLLKLVAAEAAASLVDWVPLGVPRDALDSTLWLGTQGAYTPCHYDTYGFNLHAQLSGGKRWVLFPPADSAALRPTRLPYEESSVFADVDVLSAPKCLESTTPRVVECLAGDVLFLPPYWWHSVQCVSEAPSLSVNTWVPISGDEAMRRREAVVRATVALLDDGGLIPENRAVLPSEPELDLDSALLDLQRLGDQDDTATFSDSLLSNFLEKFASSKPIPTVTFAELRTRLGCQDRKETSSERPSIDRYEFMRRLLNNVTADGFL